MNIIKTIQDKTTIHLKVELLPEELQPYLDKSYKRIAKQVSIPGFRPGHAPREMVEKEAGVMAIYQEAVDDVVEDTLPKAVQQEKIDFVGKPTVNIDTLAPGNPLAYTATFALMPKVELKQYKNVKVKFVTEPIDEKKFESTLDNLRKLRTKHEAVERSAEHGDQVMINFDIKLAGVSIEGGQGEDVPLVLGDKYFIPGFEEALLGAQAGETKQFSVTFPTDYGAKHLAGKQCDVTCTVSKVSKVLLPELDDTLAKEMNFKSLIELKEQIRKNLQTELTQKAEQKFENEVIEAVINQATFDPIPSLMMEYELDRMEQELKEQVEDQGGKFADYLQHLKKTAEDLRTSWKEHADKRIKGALVIKAVAEAEQITVTEEAITAEVERRRAYYKDAPDTLKQMEGLDFRAYVRTILRNEQAVKALTNSAKQSA